MAQPKVGDRVVVDGLPYLLTEVREHSIVCKDEARLDWEANPDLGDRGKRISVPQRGLEFHEGFEVWIIPGRENPRRSGGVQLNKGA